MKKLLSAVSLAFAISFCLTAKSTRAQEGLLPTQFLVNVDTKSTPPTNASDLTVAVNGHKQPLSAWAPVLPVNAQVALLIDSGLRQSVGRELNNLQKFIQTLPPGVEILIGYMENGRVIEAQPFTTNHVAAAAQMHLPEGIPGASASPYFCLSDFVKKWPGIDNSDPNAIPTIDSVHSAAGTAKARFVLMISNGVDPYNGSTSVMNEDSPYVQTAITDAQRAGVAVYSIYYGDAGIRGPSANFSGQTYLQNLANATGGTGYYEGTGNPVSMAPFLTQFQKAITGTYIATFDSAAVGKPRELAHIKLTASSKTKMHAPDDVRIGNVE